MSMYSNIPYKTIQIKSDSCSRKYKPGKPWWNDQLTTMWDNLSQAEKRWLRCNSKSDKVYFKAEFVKLRKIFDTEVQKSKRRHWYNIQNDLLNECNVDQSRFWKSIGRIGIGQSNTKKIPNEVILDDGSLSSDVDVVMSKWKLEFSSLFNNPKSDCNTDHSFVNVDESNLSYNNDISVLEVKKAIDCAKKGKANGIDEIPTEALQNDTSVMFLHSLFNICFSNSTVPSVWGKCIINPIKKSSSLDPRDPLSYRGISLSCSAYKLYCSILNERLRKWAEDNNIIIDEQNGFRRKRSTIDHVSTLTSIIDTRKKKRQSTFCSFIDFKKAYDYINRDMLWKKMFNIGVKGKILTAVQSLYTSISSSVRVNMLNTEWFPVKSGLRQGCILSPLLFNMYINDLALYLKALDMGVEYGDEKLCILLYADDIVLIAENEHDLQLLLNALNDWCNINDMYLNCNKSKIVHFRPKSVCKTIIQFTCGNDILMTVDRYLYLGLVLHEHLDYNIMAKVVAQSASRALGLLIAKCKSVGGLPFNVFTHLYDSCVWSIISYGAAIWGYHSYSCINAVQYRAMRFFLGVGRYTPNIAVSGDMGWVPPEIRQWKSISLYWARLSTMHDFRMNKRVALWAKSSAGRSCRNWYYIVTDMFNTNGLQQYINIESALPKHALLNGIMNVLFDKFKIDWYQSLNSVTGPSGRGRNKLRTYRLFKDGFNTESYCQLIMSPYHRAAFSKFRCGVAPLRIETGRYERLDVLDRKCPFCDNVEDESHVILDCYLYHDLRHMLFDKAVSVNPNFLSMSKNDQLVFLFTTPLMIRSCAKTCYDILKRRLLYACK
jgi:hypothetical protein